jgi:hypothetical protein
MQKVQAFGKQSTNYYVNLGTVTVASLRNRYGIRYRVTGNLVSDVSKALYSFDMLGIDLPLMWPYIPEDRSRQIKTVFSHNTKLNLNKEIFAYSVQNLPFLECLYKN